MKEFVAPSSGYVANTLFGFQFFKNKKELLEALGVREKDIDIKLYKVKKGDIRNGI